MNIFIRCIFLMLGLVAYFTNFAQSNTTIYDLLTQLRLAEADTTRMDIYIQLANVYIQDEKNADKALNYANLALILANNYEEQKRQLLALDKLLQVHQKLQPDLAKSLAFLEEMQGIQNATTSAQEQAIILGHEGKLAIQLDNYPKAQQAFVQQLALYEQLQFQEGIAQVNYDLGALFSSQNAFEEALIYFNKSLEVYHSLQDIRNSIKALNALGRAYGQMGDFAKNLQYCSEALTLAQTTDNEQLTANINANIGYAYQHLNKPIEALRYLTVAHEMSEEIDDFALLAKTANEMGNIYLQLCELDKARQHLEQAEQLEKEHLESTVLRKAIHQSFYEFHDELGNRDTALWYLQNLITIKDALHDEERMQQLITNQIKYETQLKEEENKQLKARELEQKMVIQNQKIQNYVLLIIVLFVLSIAVVLWNLFKRKRSYNETLQAEVNKRTAQLEEMNKELVASNEKLEQSNNELERFAYIASHDLKTPLRSIISFLGLIERKIRKYNDETLGEYLRFARDNARQMHYLIQDVLEFSRVDTKDSPTEEVNLNDALIHVVQNLQEDMQSKQANVFVEEMPTVQANNVHVLQLFQNLIGNGIKYNQSSRPKVFVGHQKKGKSHIFYIRDNGIGIAPEFHEQIFEMFKRLHTKEVYAGTGIGLALCKKIVLGWGGDLWLKSEEGKGTTFYFSVPV